MDKLSTGEPCRYPTLEGNELWREHEHEQCLALAEPAAAGEPTTEPAGKGDSPRRGSKNNPKVQSPRQRAAGNRARDSGRGGTA